MADYIMLETLRHHTSSSQNMRVPGEVYPEVNPTYAKEREKRGIVKIVGSTTEAEYAKLVGEAHEKDARDIAIRSKPKNQAPAPKVVDPVEPKAPKVVDPVEPKAAEVVEPKAAEAKAPTPKAAEPADADAKGLLE